MESKAEVRLCRGLCTCISNYMFCLIVTCGSEGKIRRESETWEYPQQRAQNIRTSSIRAPNIRAWSSRWSLDSLPLESKTSQAQGCGSCCPSLDSLPALRNSVSRVPSATAISALPAGPTSSSSRRVLLYLPQLVSRGGFGCTWWVPTLLAATELSVVS